MFRLCAGRLRHAAGLHAHQPRTACLALEQRIDGGGRRRGILHDNCIKPASQRRRQRNTAVGRRIEAEPVRGAVAILAMYFILFYASGLIISRLENLPLMTCLFETASALGTVGLTLGITSRLGLASRGILMALMFLGRVGGLTLIYAAQSVRKSAASTLPVEKITVG